MRGFKQLIVCGLVLIAALAIPTAGIPLSLRPTGSGLCSLSPLPLGRDTAETYFVGTALADTILAGPGDVKPSPDGGHWGRGEPRAVYGQLVRVDTLGGAQAQVVREAIPNSQSRDVVIVPWDYDPACEPTYWSMSARWVEPGLVGFYEVKLRPRPQWAGNRPTFDAFTADLEPYPHGPFFGAGFRGANAVHSRAALNAREMFEFYARLPVWREWKLDAQALEPLERWARENPTLANKYPADEVLHTNRRRLHAY
jgi:hypothetical protein